MATLWLDTETYSPVPIRHGVHAYAAQAELLLLAYALGDGAVQVWDATASPRMPAALRAALDNPDVTITAHNAYFDRTILSCTHPHIPLPAARWLDTMAQALLCSLPAGLGDLCTVLGVPQDKAKDKAGKRLIQLFCRPRPSRCRVPRATRETHPAEWVQLIAYAAQDVEAMREAARRIPRADSDEERALWVLDQIINDRGVLIDTALVEGALAAVAQEQAALAAQVAAITGGTVQAATQRDALLAHIAREYGAAPPDLRKATVSGWMSRADTPEGLRELLDVRRRASASSVAKYKMLAQAVGGDGRLRGTLQYCGASRTGRWSGRIFQPQNLPRPTLPQEDIDRGIGALVLGCADTVADDVTRLASSALRGCIIAPPGRKLVVADLANIEGRVLAWLAGEDWKLLAYRQYDAGVGDDLYKLAYARAFGVPVDAVSKDQRQIGKVMELMLGYGGGVGAYATGAAGYGIDLDAMADAALPGMPPNVVGEAARMWESQGRQPQRGDAAMSRRAWIACDALKRLWRQAHPATVALWRRLEDAARQAVGVSDSGDIAVAPRLSLRRRAGWLTIRLPSGRRLYYVRPAIAADDGALSYMGTHALTHKWTRIATYGGKLTENVTQAVSRDVLAAAMPAVEAAGYDIVMSVHDELITEAPDDPAYSAEALATLMATPPPWAEGLPLAAAGYESHRYRKE